MVLTALSCAYIAGLIVGFVILLGLKEEAELSMVQSGEIIG